MSTSNTWWRRFAELGTESALSPSLNQTIFAGNLAAAIGVGVATTNVFYYGVRYGSSLLAVLTGVAVVAYVSAILLSARGRSKLGRVIFVISATLIIFVTSDSFGGSSNEHPYFPLMVAAIFIMFEPMEERGTLLVMQAWNAALFALDLLTPTPLFMPAIGVSRDPWIPIVLCFAATYLVIAFYSSRFRWALDEIQRSNLQLVATAKMAALGRMAGGIAHEISSPLSAIQANASALLSQPLKAPDEWPRVEARLQRIVTISDRIFGIIKGLRAFCRIDTPAPMTEVELAEVVNDTLVLCRDQLNATNVELRVADLPAVRVDCRPVQIAQVLLNLLNNSFDAIENLEARWIEIAGDIDDGSVRLHVTDSGTGIPADAAHRLMEPFFTTKAPGRGTGLGLSICLGIARDHGGNLGYSLHEGHTRFSLILPARGHT